MSMMTTTRGQSEASIQVTWPIRGQYYLGGDGEHEDPEDHRDLLVEVFLLAQEQPRGLEPAQGQHEEHFIEQRQRV